MRLVLSDGLIAELGLLHAHAKLTHARLVRKLGLNLPLAETLLAHRRIDADALQGGLRDQVIGALHLLLHCSVVGLTASHKALVR